MMIIDDDDDDDDDDEDVPNTNARTTNSPLSHHGQDNVFER